MFGLNYMKSSLHARLVDQPPFHSCSRTLHHPTSTAELNMVEPRSGCQHSWMQHRSAHAGKRINPGIYLRRPVPGDPSETGRNCVAHDIDFRPLRVSLLHLAALSSSACSSLLLALELSISEPYTSSTRRAHYSIIQIELSSPTSALLAGHGWVLSNMSKGKGLRVTVNIYRSRQCIATEVCYDNLASQLSG